MSAKVVVVLGATGMIGGAVTRQLLAAGHKVRAIVRSGDAAKSRLPSAVEVVQGDVSEAARLHDAVGSADAILFSLSVDPKRTKKNGFNPDRDGLLNLISALEPANAPRILYVASLLQDRNPHGWWVLSAKREAVRALEASGLPHTIFKPSNFIENLAHRNLRGTTIALIGKPKHRNWWIAADDFGRQVAAHVASLSHHTPPALTYAVQGTEALDYQEAARVFAANHPSQALKVAFAPVPLFAILGRFIPELGYAYAISRASNDAPEAFQAQATWDAFGKPTTTVAQFARQQV